MPVGHVALAVALTAVACAGATAVGTLVRVRRGVAARPALLATGLDAALLLALAVIGLVTLWPAATDPTNPARLIPVPFDSSPANLVGNIALFMPSGALVALRIPAMDRSWRIGVAGAALSLCIETAQYFLIPGRHADIDDLIGNTIGALAGYLLLTRRAWAGAVASAARSGRRSRRATPPRRRPARSKASR